MKEVSRSEYITRLDGKRGNRMVKVITGIRRCGKSYLLFHLFRRHLMEHGVKDDHIIALALDDFINQQYLQPEALYRYVTERIKDSEMHYVLLDEIQLVEGFEAVLNGFLHRDNLDVYVTGSNSRFLSTDIATEFRGRSYEIHLAPLSFAEYFSTFTGSVQDAWDEYSL